MAKTQEAVCTFRHGLWRDLLDRLGTEANGSFAKQGVLNRSYLAKCLNAALEFRHILLQTKIGGGLEVNGLADTRLSDVESLIDGCSSSVICPQRKACVRFDDGLPARNGVTPTPISKNLLRADGAGVGRQRLSPNIRGGNIAAEGCTR